MCVTRLPLAGGCGPRGPSPVRGNTLGSRYRVLREVPSRGGPRSVDRECAGRNAMSVKGSSPDKQNFSWWPSQYEEAKAAPIDLGFPSGSVAYASSDSARPRHRIGTTGVQDHGMYTRSAAERERSATGRTNRRPRSRVSEQGVTSEFKTIPDAEDRCSRSSEEVG